MKEEALGLVNLIAEGNWLAATIVGVPVFIFLFRMLYSLITELKERKINYFKKALEVEGLSEEVRFIVLENLNQAYFYRATGLTASPYFRLRVCDFLEFTTKNISLFSIWRCHAYITFNEDKLSVKFERFYKIGFGWHIFSIIVAGIASLIILVLLLVTWGVAIEGKWIIVVELITLLGIAVHSLWKVISFRFARDILGPEFIKFESSRVDQNVSCEKESDFSQSGVITQKLEEEVA